MFLSRFYDLLNDISMFNEPKFTIKYSVIVVYVPVLYFKNLKSY